LAHDLSSATSVMTSSTTFSRSRRSGNFLMSAECDMGSMQRKCMTSFLMYPR